MLSKTQRMHSDEDDVTLPIQIADMVFRKLPFCKYYHGISKMGPEAHCLFLDTHDKCDYLKLGQSVDLSLIHPTYESPSPFFKETIVTKVLSEGRAIQICTDTKFEYVDGPSVMFTNGGEVPNIKSIHSWDNSIWIILQNEKWKIVKASGKLRSEAGYFFNDNTEFMHANELPSLSFQSPEKAEAWLQQLNSLKPGDKIIIQNEKIIKDIKDKKAKETKKTKETKEQKKSTDISAYYIEHIFYDQKHADSFPDWLVTPDKRLSFHFIPKGLSTPISYESISSITPCIKTPCFVANSRVIQKGQYVVIKVSGFPIAKVVDTSEHGYSVRKDNTNMYANNPSKYDNRNDRNNLWHLSSSYPHVEVFKTRIEAKQWRTKQLDYLKLALDKINVGDLILRRQDATKSDGKHKTENKYVHVKKISLNNILPDIDLLDDDELGHLDDSEFSGNESSMSKTKTIIPVHTTTHHYYIDSKTFVERKDIQDVILLKDQHTITLSMAGVFSNKIDVEVGFLLNLKASGKNYSKIRIERIVNNGVVFDGMFFLADKIMVTSNYLENTKRKYKQITTADRPFKKYKKELVF